MRKIRIILIILVICFITPILIVGCEQQSKNPSVFTKKDKEPMNISIAIWDIGTAFNMGEQDKILQKIQKKFNIVFKPINLSRTNWTEELQRYAAAGSLPDIVFNDIINTATYEAWVDKKIVRAIPSDMSKYPLLKTYVDKKENEIFRRKDGDFYMIPRLTYSSEDMWALDRCVVVRKDWMESLGIADPQNFFQFKEMLRKFKTMDPDKNGVDDTMGFTAVNMNLLEALYLGIFPELSNIERGWMKEDNRWMPVYNSKRVADALSCVKELYDEGLMSADFAYQNSTQARDDFIQGKVGAVASQYNILAETYHTQNPQSSFTDIAKVLPMWKAPDGERYRFTTSSIWSESYISANVNDEKMDKILELYNYLLSDEATELLSFGMDEKDAIMKQVQTQYPEQEYQDIKEVYPSVDVFRNLVSWWEMKAYKDNLQNTLQYGEKSVRYSIAQLEWYGKNTKRVNYNYDIIFMSTPSKNLLPTHKNIHNEMLKIIVGSQPAKKAWEAAITKIRNDTTLNQAIEEVTNRAQQMGL